MKIADTYLPAAIVFAMVLAACAAAKILTPAEQAVQDKYYDSYPGTIFQLHPDMWADGEVYKQNYMHGIYDAAFEAIAVRTDFMHMPANVLQRKADSIYADLLPVIPRIELYDSIRVRFITRYKSRQPDEWPSADTSMHLVERRYAYGLRKK